MISCDVNTEIHKSCGKIFSIKADLNVGTEINIILSELTPMNALMLML